MHDYNPSANDSVSHFSHMNNDTNSLLGGYTPKTSRIIKLVIQVMPGYRDQYLRPMHVHATHQSINTITNQICNTYANVMGAPQSDMDSFSSAPLLAQSIAPVSSMFISPSSSTEGIGQIAGGWAQERCRFYMEVQHTSALGYVANSIVIGYTNFSGVSNLTGLRYNIDKKEMVFYIDTIIDAKSISRKTPSGYSESILKVTNQKQVLSNPLYGSTPTSSRQYGTPAHLRYQSHPQSSRHLIDSGTSLKVSMLSALQDAAAPGSEIDTTSSQISQAPSLLIKTSLCLLTLWLKQSLTR